VMIVRYKIYERGFGKRFDRVAKSCSCLRRSCDGSSNVKEWDYMNPS
jgi:hypothetical protein